MSIKPVAWMRTGAEKSDGPFGHYGPVKIYSDDAALFAIPYTHRVVPVELLQLISEAAHTGLRHTRAKNDSRALVWTNAIADLKGLLAAAKEKGE